MRKNQKYMLNLNGDIYRYITYEEATKLIEKEKNNPYHWFRLYEEKEKTTKKLNIK